jgi:hypothetical protein
MYGYDTHSWRNSTEKRQLDRERRDTTTRYERGQIKIEPIAIAPLCRCDAVPYPHDPKFWHGQDWPIVWTPPPKHGATPGQSQVGNRASPLDTTGGSSPHA